MRIAIISILTLTSALALAQTSPVHWNMEVRLNSPGHYTIEVRGVVEKGWHVYAKQDSALGLEPLKITWDRENVLPGDSRMAPGSRGESCYDYRDPVFDHKVLKVYRKDIHLEQDLKVEGTVPPYLAVTVKGFASNDREFIPVEEVRRMALPGSAAVSQNAIKLSRVNLTHPVNDCGEDPSKAKGLLAIFLLGCLGGLFALITPCVFPMIPVTVSFFMGRSESRAVAIKNGLLYGTFIFLIYLLASSPFHLIKGIDKNIFNSIATNAWVNVAFFIIFILFSLSFFGLFEISLPGSAATKVDARSGLSTVPGIFFMALTLAIVSFSCTGVILGVLLANVAADGPWALTAGMAGFGLSLALPFVLFAVFPNLLKALPKSGSWLGTVKKSLAFVELALAFKFLSNADLVEHWGLLKREVFIGIWILIALGLAFYLVGFFEKKRIIVSGLQNADYLKTQKTKLSKFRISLGVLSLLFAFYLLPGLFPAKQVRLNGLSGFPPPLSYSIYGKSNLPGLEPAVINDYKRALQLAKEEGKPLLIDFTGWACVNCRKMEEQVWTKASVQQIIREKYILVSLYVDDRKKLPADRQFSYITASGEDKEVKTLGDQWAAFQAENFNQVTQPLYVVLSPDETLLNHPVGYTPNDNEYRQWLECGLNAFQKERRLGFKQ